jgi:hypothetical protein
MPALPASARVAWFDVADRSHHGSAERGRTSIRMSLLWMPMPSRSECSVA